MANVVTALVPEVWSALIQIPLRKSLVAIEVCNTSFEADLKVGDTIHYPYISTLSAVDYTPGTDLTAQDFTATDESLIVDQKKAVPFYVDDVNELQAKPDYAGAVAEDAAYQLQNAIDTKILTLVENGTEWDDGDLGGVDGSAITATTANIIQIFSTARKTLRSNNVEEAGDWAAVVTPSLAMLIERLATEKGFTVVDTTLQNGYAGNFLGFKIYVSNNALSQTYGGRTSTYATFIGKLGSIHFVMQRDPQMAIKDVSNRLGKNYICSTVYGAKAFAKGAARFLDAKIYTG